MQIHICLECRKPGKRLISNLKYTYYLILIPVGYENRHVKQLGIIESIDEMPLRRTGHYTKISMSETGYAIEQIAVMLEQKMKPKCITKLIFSKYEMIRKDRYQSK